MSYADILRSVKTDPDLAAMSETVTRIRRTQKGGLILQLSESEKNADFKSSIMAKLGESAEVRTLSQRITVEVRDIDEISTIAEINEAVRTHIGPEVLPDNAVTLKKAYGETQIATMSLPGEAAKKLLELGKLRIGWTICRIRERIELKKCFKCLEFGHIAKQCRSQVDRYVEIVGKPDT